MLAIGRLFFVALVSTVVIAGKTYAAEPAQCPEQLKKVDSLLQRNPKLPAEELAKAKKLRDQGEVLMKGGKTKECRIALNRAEKMLAKGLK